MRDMDETSEIVMTGGVGILCYGILGAMILYALCHVVEWHPILWLFIFMLAFCAAMVIYSSIKLYKLLKRKQ